MNKSKRVLSFILAFILSLSTALSYIGTVNVSAEDEEIILSEDSEFNEFLVNNSGVSFDNLSGASALANIFAAGGHDLPLGSGVRDPDPDRRNNFGSSTGPVGAASLFGFRIGLIPTSVFFNGEYGYFKVHTGNSDHVDRISLKSDVVDESNKNAALAFARSTPEAWYYITPENKGDRLYSFYLGGKEFTAIGRGFDSEVVTRFKEVLGIKGDVSNFNNWDAAIQSYNRYGQGHSDDDDLAKLFNPELAGKYYLIVVEGLRPYYNETMPYGQDLGDGVKDYSKRFIWTSYQDYVNDSSSIHALTGKSTMNKVPDTAFRDVSWYVNQGSIAPFGLEWAEGNPIRTGFCVYGDINGENGDPFALNITLEYQGEPNTSVGSKFVSAGSLVKKVTTKPADAHALGKSEGDVADIPSEGADHWKVGGSSKSYWDKDNKKWVETTDNDEFLQETKKGVDVEDPYAVVFKDYYPLWHDAMDISMTKLLDAADTNIRYYGNYLLTGAITDYELTWADVLVTGGDTNIGCSYKPSTINGAADTSQIFASFLIKLADGTTTNLFNACKDNNTAKTILDSCIQTVTLAYGKTDNDAAGTIYGTEELKLRRGKKLGVAVEFIAKGSEIESHKVTVNVAADGSVSSSETWNDKYSSAGSTTTNIDSGAKCYVVVKNIYRNDANVENALKNLADRDAETLVLAVKNALGGDAFVKFSQKQGGKSICVGCEPKAYSDPTLDGYTIYEIKVAGDVSTGAVELPSYMLNRYFQNIIQKSSSPTTKYQVNKDFTRKKEAYSGSITCSRCGEELKYKDRSEDVKYWELIWTDISSGTKHTDYDKDTLLGRYFIKMNSGVWSHANRTELVSGVTQDTKDWAEPSGYVMDYGFNLIRASVDDNRAVSGISYADYASFDADNLLQIKDNFGVVPAETIKEASGKRDPMASAGNVTDTLKIKSEFDLTKSEDGYDDELTDHDHAEEGHNEGNPPTYVKDKDKVEIDYYKLLDKKVKGFYKEVGSSPSKETKLEYSFTSTVRKYQTDTIVDGENSKIVAPATHTPIPTNASKVSDGAVQDGNEYRFANVRYNSIALKFFPEVKMVTCIGGTDWASVASKGYSIVATMGEKERTSKSSSLYLFKINGSGDDAVKGTTYTDSAEGGTSIKGSNKITIPAGSDVYVDADPDGVTVDLYGYTLDCIDATIDATFKTSASTTRNYTDVVKSGEDVDTKWNGSANKDTLKTHFETWANNVLNVENFSADFELYVGGSKKADNFSAVVGRIQRGSTTATEDGVYQLQVANGALVKNDDYSKMIAQIAADYQCSDSEAEAVFEASGIYTAILNAIESSTSSFNKSGGCGLNMTWTSQLGNSTNWYDEKVNTFVIRRFTNLGNKIKDITATDKIDFGLAPSSRGGTKQNSNYNNTNGASWKLNVFFNPSIKEHLIGDGDFYNPGNTSVSLEGANNKYTVLMRGVPVKNADFNISSTSTSDFKN